MALAQQSAFECALFHFFGTIRLPVLYDELCGVRYWTACGAPPHMPEVDACRKRKGYMEEPQYAAARHFDVKRAKIDKSWFPTAEEWLNMHVRRSTPIAASLTHAGRLDVSNYYDIDKVIDNCIYAVLEAGNDCSSTVLPLPFAGNLMEFYVEQQVLLNPDDIEQLETHNQIMDSLSFE